MGIEEISFLSQLVESLEEAELKLEEAYEKKDHDGFDMAKRFIVEIQKKISEVLS